jgi:hypothetical protein
MSLWSDDCNNDKYKKECILLKIEPSILAVIVYIILMGLSILFAK